MRIKYRMFHVARKNWSNGNSYTAVQSDRILRKDGIFSKVIKCFKYAFAFCQHHYASRVQSFFMAQADKSFFMFYIVAEEKVVFVSLFPDTEW